MLNLGLVFLLVCLQSDTSYMFLYVYDIVVLIYITSGYGTTVGLQSDTLKNGVPLASLIGLLGHDLKLQTSCQVVSEPNTPG